MKADLHADPTKPMYCCCNNEQMRQSVTGVGMTWVCDRCGNVVYRPLSRTERRLLEGVKSA